MKRRSRSIERKRKSKIPTCGVTEGDKRRVISRKENRRGRNG
jgi:hypothetical protein